MLDQIVWLLGRPHTVTSFLRHDSDRVPGFADNTLAVLEYGRAMAVVDIAAMETQPMARRFEVYGHRGSAILIEPFEPAQRIRLCLDSTRENYQQGEQFLAVTPQDRQELYGLELDAFLASIAGQRPADRSLEHELLVQETLLRCTGAIPV
jgi:predicted dehydrogenase